MLTVKSLGSDSSSGAVALHLNVSPHPTYLQSNVIPCCHAAGDKQGLRSPVTSHMLDTSVGRPAHNVPIMLERLCEGSVSVWERVGQGTTNADGRVGDLMRPADSIEAGVYR